MCEVINYPAAATYRVADTMHISIGHFEINHAARRSDAMRLERTTSLHSFS